MALTLDYSVDDGIATITLNRPDRLNAINKNLLRDLLQALRDANGDEEVKVMVLDTQADLKNLKKAGASRISFGPAPYFASMSAIGAAAKRHF